MNRLNKIKKKEMKYYAGIGSRGTPQEILSLMTRLATKLEQNNWTLRSGGARGADSAFKHGIKEYKNCKIYTAESLDYEGNVNAAYKSVDEFHPNPRVLSGYVRRLMARNYFQVMGKRSGVPSKFIVCWTPDYKLDEEEKVRDAAGGTGQAIRIAYANKIDVYNLKHKQHFEKISSYINKVNT